MFLDPFASRQGHNHLVLTKKIRKREKKRKKKDRARRREEEEEGRRKKKRCTLPLDPDYKNLHPSQPPHSVASPFIGWTSVRVGH